MAQSQKAFSKILALLLQHTAVDFTFYKQATLRRRMERRIASRKLKSLDAYAQYLQAHPAEVKALFNDILINVTGFFRDPAAFDGLRKKFIPQLLRAEKTGVPIRIWVPACSTGEEVFSLAIILMEAMERKKIVRPVQIFGTDINDTVLDKARAGVYPDSIRRQVSPERLNRFFEPVAGGFRVRKNIRGLCTFARHNFTADPPFSNLDLISCHNVLIYLNPQLQSRVMPLFHFALRAHGLLMLGSSETTGNFSHLFAVGDKRIKVYSKKPVAIRKLPEVGFSPTVHVPMGPARGEKAATPRPHHLEPEQLRALVDKAVHRNARGSEQTRVVPLAIPHTQDKLYLVFVDPQEAKKKGGPKTKDGAPDKSEVARLRRELSTMQGSLQAIIEQEEATNEELRAANEEIVSSNEELQSTNEELETTKEELQSSNEELAMLNSELENRNAELERTNLVQSQIAAIVESSDDAIISKNLNSIILTWNKGAERIFGYTAAEVIGKPITILIPPEDQHEEPAILARLRRGERIEHYETIRLRKDGKKINISLTVSPIKNTAGEVVGASKIARDITDKKRWEEELKYARDEAERASHAKDDFLAALSHELRTPLNPVLLVASDAAANLDLPPGVRANFDMIRRNVELEARLIDDLLDLTRITSGKLKLDKRSVNIHAVLKTTVAMLQSEIENREIVLTQKFEAFQNIISGDTVRLQQIFWNVLKNAMKFTPPRGTIAIETRSAGEEYVVTIADSGIGMTAQELARAFNAFTQGDHSEDARRFGGLGLGLTISKKLVELHSGSIEAFSEGRNRGSRFVLRFPLADWNKRVERETSSPPAPRTKIAGVQILLVEDHEPTRSALAALLVSRKLRVTLAVSMREALALAAKNQFDAVISDIGLPDGNGYDLLKKLRKQFPDIKGIALTGYGMNEDVTRSQESGFEMHLTKPVRIQSLEAALAQVLVD